MLFLIWIVISTIMFIVGLSLWVCWLSSTSNGRHLLTHLPELAIFPLGVMILIWVAAAEMSKTYENADRMITFEIVQDVDSGRYHFIDDTISKSSSGVTEITKKIIDIRSWFDSDFDPETQKVVGLDWDWHLGVCFMGEPPNSRLTYAIVPIEFELEK